MKNSSPWERGLDLNQRFSGYGPDELPNCSTPQYKGRYYLAPTAGHVSTYGITIMSKEVFHILPTDRIHSMQNSAK